MWDWIMIKDALRAIVEIFILWVFLYQIYRAFHATRGARIMVGLFACFLALVVLAFFFQLNVISWILTRIFAPGPGAGAGGDFPAGAACGAGEAGQPSVLLLLRQASAG